MKFVLRFCMLLPAAVLMFVCGIFGFVLKFAWIGFRAGWLIWATKASNYVLDRQQQPGEPYGKINTH